MKRILGVLMIVALMFALVACGGDDLIGTWEVKDTEGLEDFGMSFEITFEEDTMTMFGITVDYETKGDKIIMSFMGEEEEWEYKVKGDTLTLIADGEELELEKVK